MTKGSVNFQSYWAQQSRRLQGRIGSERLERGRGQALLGWLSRIADESVGPQIGYRHLKPVASWLQQRFSSPAGMETRHGSHHTIPKYLPLSRTDARFFTRPSERL